MKYNSDGTITASAFDRDFYLNNFAVHVCGYCGDRHMNQFSGVGSSPAPYKMKALLVNGVIYIPNPRTRGEDGTERNWIVAPVQPDRKHIEIISDN